MELLNQFKPDDVLSDALCHLHVRGALYCRSNLRTPWAFSVERRPTLGFHAVTRGRGWLEVEGEDRKILVSKGDLVLLPHGHSHVMRDSSKSEPKSLDEIVAESPPEDGIRLQAGGKGPLTVLLCGGFQVEGRTTNPLLANLPNIIHIRGRNGQSVSWLQTTLRQIEVETRSTRPGTQTVIARLSDILLIQAVRAYFNELTRGATGGWFGALKDPQVGAAIAQIHRQPEVSWDVTSLAAKVGMSRSNFSAKFGALVGESPLKYLTKWRVQKAAWLLRTSDAKLSEIAERIGYESEIALSRAFNRFMGVPPGKYRRSHARDH
jgi:AraC-like DNA-binding protein